MCRETRHPKSVKNTFRVRFFKVEISCFSHLFPLFFIALAHAEKNIRLIAKNTRHLF